MVKGILLTLAVLQGQLLLAQSTPKITGPLGVYHVAQGYAYTDTTGLDSLPLQAEFEFGEMFLSNRGIDGGFGFEAQVDSCTAWKPNRVFAIVEPVSEGGSVNQPNDTALYAPYIIQNLPGMIQAAQRFSKLSQLYGGFCGGIIDDWNGDTSLTRQVRDAIRGKCVYEDGYVETNSLATTPDNKLFGAIYSTGANAAAMPVLDGFAYWYIDNQNCCYTNLDGDISQLRTNFPSKEIMIGIYLKNSHLGWADPVGVHYMLQHALDRYDDGDINGIILFAEPYLAKSYIALSQWNALALPFWLDSIYYPYLGAGQGKIYDCHTGNILPDAFIRVYCKGRTSGDTLMRSRQKTDEAGEYQLGLWAGNRNTDSTYYWLIAEKGGYNNDTVGFWMKRNDTTYIPNIVLCPDTTTAIIPKADISVYPNPTTGRFTVRLNAAPAPDSELEIYNMQGEKVYSATPTHLYSHIDLSFISAGVYIVAIKSSGRIVERKRVLVLGH